MSHKHLVLGLLLDQPMTGYDIRKHVQTVLSAATSTSYGTLYPVLHRLLTDGCVVVQEIPQKGRPPKKVYRITPSGERELTAWLKQPPEADKIRREFLLKLYLARHLPRHELLNLLEQRRAETIAALNTLRIHSKKGNHEPDAWIMEYVTALHKAEIAWLDNVTAGLAEVVRT
jgi:DNA-binding PadR family transcriptional regulator